MSRASNEYQELLTERTSSQTQDRKRTVSDQLKSMLNYFKK